MNRPSLLDRGTAADCQTAIHRDRSVISPAKTGCVNRMDTILPQATDTKTGDHHPFFARTGATGGMGVPATGAGFVTTGAGGNWA